MRNVKFVSLSLSLSLSLAASAFANTSAPSRPGVADRLQTISILLFDSPERPSAARLIHAFSARNEPLPIAGLGLHRPIQLEYFLSQRLSPESAALINREPNSPRAKLERMVLAHYPASARLDTIIAVLNADPNVIGVAEFSSGENEGAPAPPPAPSGPLPANNQVEQNNLPEAWALSPGHATIGVVDMGIDAPVVAGAALAHPELRAFTRNAGVSTYTGGNWLEALSFDLSVRDANQVRVVYPFVDEAGFHGQSVSAACTASNRVLAVGHGTHVAGLIASNHGYITPGTDPKGSCVHCGLQVWKTTRTECFDQSVPAVIRPDLTNSAIDLVNTRANWWEGVVSAADTGAQVINMSFNVYPGGGNTTPWTQTCRPRTLSNGQPWPDRSNQPDCLSLAWASEKNVAMVGAAGNILGGAFEWIPFPALDDRVVTAGGTTFNGSGSSVSRFFTNGWPNPADAWIQVHERKQDSAAPAEIVLSSIYRKSRYIVSSPPSVFDCADTNLATINGGPLDQVDDGAGYCTATDQGFIDAHNWLFTARGIPVIYYGSEIGFMRGRVEHNGNRNYFGSERIAQAKTHPIKLALKRIASVRKASIALQKGLQLNLDFKGDGALFYRVYQHDGVAQTALVMLNKSAKVQTLRADRYLAQGEWRDAMSDERMQVGSSLKAKVPAHGVRVFLHNGVANDAATRRELQMLMARKVTR